MNQRGSGPRPYSFRLRVPNEAQMGWHWLTDAESREPSDEELDAELAEIAATITPAQLDDLERKVADLIAGRRPPRSDDVGPCRYCPPPRVDAPGASKPKRWARR